jgi:hypothetical protein
MAFNLVRIHRMSNTLKDVDARHLKLMHEAVAESHEILKSPVPDTFAGRKTQESFPTEDDILD